MKVITTTEPVAIVASRRSVAAVASLVMYIDTPLDDTTARAASSKPASTSAVHQSASASKSTGTRRSPSGTPYPSSSSRCRFHAWGPGWSISNTVIPSAGSS